METNNDSTHHPNVSLNPPADAYEQTAAERAALDDGELPPLTVDLAGAARTALDTWLRIERLLASMESVGGGLDLEAIRALPTYAKACQHAQFMWVEGEEPSELVTEASTVRSQLLSSAETLVEYDLVDAERVAAIRSGRGHDELGDNLLQLVDLYVGLDERVRARTLVDDAMILRAVELADELGRRRVHGKAEAERLEEARKAERMRAWALLASAYDECRRAVTFLRWHQRDADEFAPSLYAKRRRSATDVEDDSTEAAEPASE